MRLRSSEYRGCGDRLSTPVELLTAALLLSILGVGLRPTPSAAEEAAADVAYVEDVSGRVIASVQGKPTLLDALDLIGERTRLDLQANSEVRICHHRTQRLFALKGPLRASVSRDGVTVENGKAASAGSCAAPVVSIFQGGVALRSAGVRTMEVPLRPSIKVVDHSTRPIRRIALWDGEQRKVLATFDRDTARPILDDGQSYILVVGRGDGSEFKLKLLGNAGTRTGPLILVLR
jgi:hypothetical protein